MDKERDAAMWNEDARKAAKDKNWKAIVDNHVKIQQATPHVIFEVGFELGYADGYQARAAEQSPRLKDAEAVIDHYTSEGVWSCGHCSRRDPKHECILDTYFIHGNGYDIAREYRQKHPETTERP